MIENISKKCTYGLCMACGLAAKTSSMFVKNYTLGGVCLCKNCAKELSIEITEHYEEDKK